MAELTSQGVGRVRPVLGLTLVLMLWTLVMLASFVSFGLTEPTGEGVTRGMNRVAVFLSWQLVGLVLAVPAWTMGRGLFYQPIWLWLSRTPGIWAIALVAGISSMVILSALGV